VARAQKLLSRFAKKLNYRFLVFILRNVEMLLSSFRKRFFLPINARQCMMCSFVVHELVRASSGAFVYYRSIFLEFLYEICSLGDLCLVLDLQNVKAEEDAFSTH